MLITNNVYLPQLISNKNEKNKNVNTNSKPISN